MRLTIALAVLLLSGCGGGADAPLKTAEATTPPKLILGIGDSIMAGYIPGDGLSQRLAQRESFMRELETVGAVVGAPVGGASTRAALENQTAWALTPFDPALPPPTPSVVVVMLGTNDAVLGYSREQAAENVRQILERFPHSIRVVVSPPRWDDDRDAWMAAWNRDLQVLAQANGARFVDAYTPSLTRPWQCTPTNKHPCETAHREIGRLILKAL